MALFRLLDSGKERLSMICHVLQVQNVALNERPQNIFKY